MIAWMNAYWIMSGGKVRVDRDCGGGRRCDASGIGNGSPFDQPPYSLPPPRRTGDDDREGGSKALRMLRGVEQGAHGFEALLRGGAEPAVGADAAEALWQNVLEEAVEEGFAAEGEGALDVSFRFAIAEGDAAIVLVKEPLTRECGPGDVAGEIA
jgi:hypothetical protein